MTARGGGLTGFNRGYGTLVNCVTVIVRGPDGPGTNTLVHYARSVAGAATVWRINELWRRRPAVTKRRPDRFCGRNSQLKLSCTVRYRHRFTLM